MVRHNNMIPHAHFHKKWKEHVKMWFNQPMKKRRRAAKRRARANSILPGPAEKLRPMIHCPTVRYNAKVRAGRGFTLRELKAAGLSKKFAPTIGLAVDPRRRNKSFEGMRLNVQRLKEYRSRLILFPLNRKKWGEAMKAPFHSVVHGINKPVQVNTKEKARVPSEDEKAFSAFHYLRKTRTDAKYANVRLKHKKAKGEHLELPVKKVRLQAEQD